MIYFDLVFSPPPQFLQDSSCLPTYSTLHSFSLSKLKKKKKHTHTFHKPENQNKQKSNKEKMSKQSKKWNKISTKILLFHHLWLTVFPPASSTRIPGKHASRPEGSLTLCTLFNCESPCKFPYTAGSFSDVGLKHRSTGLSV